MHDGDILQGLGSIFGKAITAISKGGSAIIKAVGHGTKEGLEGLGEFSEKVAHGMAESTDSLISSGGHAIHEAEMGAGQFMRDSFGGIGGVILLGLVLLIVGYMLYISFCKKTISGSSTNISSRHHASCENCALPGENKGFILSWLYPYPSLINFPLRIQSLLQ